MKQKYPAAGATVRGALAALILLTLQSCADSISPGSRVASLSVSGAPATTLNVGDTVRLSVTAVASNGAAVTAPSVTWSTTAPSVASVSEVGLVTALAPGTARVIARAAGLADSVDIVVQARASAAGCPAGGLVLAVGEVRQISAAGDPALCLPGAAAGSDYVVITFNGQEVAPLRLTLEASSAASAMSVSRSMVAAGRPDLFSPGLQRDAAFEAGLRRTERTQLRRYLPATRVAGLAAARSASAVAAVPTVGSTLSLNVSQEACSNAVRKTGRVAAVSRRAIVVHDTENPAGGFTDAAYQEIAETFDTLVWKVDSLNFGVPTDLDQNERVIIFYTRAVNALTEANSDSYVGGFFFGRDLFPSAPQSGFETCAGSNYAEILYLLAPDPTGTVNGNRRTTEFVRKITVGTLAHELEHLILASRRLHVVKTTNYFEETWLEEGLAHIAEELVFYRASGLTPGLNLDITAIRAQERRRVAFNAYAGDNFARYEKHVLDPESSSPYAKDDELSTRGATWAFLRYAADRVGGDQAVLWNRLVNANVTGFANLRNSFGTEPIPLVRDWAVSVYADDVVAGLPAISQQPSWNYRSIFSVLFPEKGYALPLRDLSTTPTSLTLIAGGTAYFNARVPALTTSRIRIRSAGVAPPAAVSAFVVRTR